MLPRKKKGATPGEKKKKKRQLEEVVHIHMDIFVNQEKVHSHSVFSPFWGENILIGLGRKYLGPIFYFPSFLPNQTHSKKVFFFQFFLQSFSFIPFHFQTNTP